MWRTGVNVYKTEGGLLALYGGYIPTVAGVAPYVSGTVCSGFVHLLTYKGWPELHDI